MSLNTELGREVANQLPQTTRASISHTSGGATIPLLWGKKQSLWGLSDMPTLPQVMEAEQ